MTSSRWIGRTPGIVILFVWSFLVIVPLVILVFVAIKSPSEVLNDPLSWPKSIQWSNFGDAWDKAGLGTAFLNSALITVTSVAGLVLLGSTAAYSLARTNSRWANYSYIYFISGIIAPFGLAAVPLYRLMKSLELINTLYGVILVYVAGGLSFVIFLYAGFIKTVPREMEEAAMIDGCGAFRTFWQIVFPLLKPVTATVIITSSLGIWNDFFTALLFLQRKEIRTIPVAISSFVGEYNDNWTAIFASIVMASLPMIIIFLVLQQYFIKGITSGAVKG